MPETVLTDAVPTDAAVSAVPGVGTAEVAPGLWEEPAHQHVWSLRSVEFGDGQSRRTCPARGRMD